MDIFKLQSSVNSSDKLVEGEDYLLVDADNKGSHKIRVFNLGNTKNCPREGYVELQPLKTSKRHENWLNFSFCYDNKTGIYYGIPAGYDTKTGLLKWQRIIVREIEVLNRAVPAEAMKAAVCMNSYYVQGSPLVKGKPKYKVYDKEQEANEFVKELTNKQKAIAIAAGLTGIHLVEMGLNLGFVVETMSPAILYMEVNKYADKNHKKFLEIYNDADRHILTVINRGLATGILTEEVGLGICYGKVQVGISKERAVDTLKGNDQLRQTIDQLSKKKESDSVKAMSTPGSTPPEIKDEKDAEIARLRKSNEEMEKRMKELNDAKIQSLTEAETDAEAANDPEFEELRKEAQALGIRGYKLYGKEKLRQKIEEERASKNN